MLRQGMTDRRRYLFGMTDLQLMSASVALMVCIAVSFYVAMRLRVTYQTETEVRLLQAEIDRHTKDYQARQMEIQKELDALKQTLYGPLTAAQASQSATAQQRKPSSVEQWQINRDEELRKRIQALEQWRFSHEAAETQ